VGEEVQGAVIPTPSLPKGGCWKGKKRKDRTMTLDKLTRDAVTAAVREALAGQAEEWMSGEQLCEKFQMFTPDWLKRYGWKLPRARVEFEGDDGKRHHTRWAYPRKEIEKIINKQKI
jgi:hypothetical protein